MMNAQMIDEYFKNHREEHLEELKAFLRIPSISSLSEHKDDVRKGAEWLRDAMEKAGLENAKVFETEGHPVVYADWLHAEGKPTVLVYGHYDVQPVDPLNLWETPPFDPQVRDNKLYARGASDDKGQTFMHVKAVEALLQLNGELPVNIKFIVEGEEEIGSPTLPKYVEQNKEQLKADLIVISDTGMQGPGRPAVCYGLRGLAGIQIDVKGPKGDLHSGLYGGAVQNPLHAIVEILQSFRDKEGVIQVEGFYEDVLEVSDEERAEFAALEFNLEKEKQDLGITDDFGEKGYSFVERTWIRPTLEINGITGGFSGEGIKTVLPAEASAKITCRLVPDQDPDDIVAKLRAHVEANKPAGVTVEISDFDKGQPFLTPYDHPAIQAAGRSYEKVYNVKTAFTRMGGSVPIVAVFDQVLGLPVVLMGFGLSSENFHAPNEHFHLENFDKGLRVISDYLFEAANL
ncbi:dipeptidase [Planococcus liqunii]|uniref:dipeptidase n=1 Tax=Planococcus liqunii TaxID=3058394 RepID=UPI002627737F|nr:dipeptidase [Planococcus sp. N056]WKA52992.1 dipeptidase [Planococcus sp. N056]